MGKHDKTVFTWDAPETSFLEAENKRLKAENEKLKNTIKILEREMARNERVSEKMDKLAADKDAEIARWKAKALGLVDTYV